MQNDDPSVALEIPIPIKYQEFIGGRYNADFRGKGMLVIKTGGLTTNFTFTGTKRQTFSFSRNQELHFQPDQIWNVLTDGRCVQFMTRVGQNDSKTKLFVFFCRSVEDAKTVAQHLPVTRDDEFHAVENFNARLNEVSGANDPWRSVTNIIIAANAFVFVVMGFLGAGWIDVADMMPYLRYGANNGGATTDGEWWRLVTSMFMHYGVFHLLLNMWALFQAGHLLEKLLGRGLYALTYIGSGIIGSLVTLMWHGDKMWSAGASGAVFGVYGALLGYMLREKNALPPTVYKPLLKSTLTFAGYNLFYGMVHPRIDNAAHLGGLAGGLMLGWIVALPLDATLRAQFGPKRLRLGATVLFLAIIVGVTLAPRFAYSFSEELTWGQANKALIVSEPAITKREESLVTEFQRTQRGTELAQWLRLEAIPFNEKWITTIGSLQLTRGRATEQRRQAFSKILQLRVDSYRHLLAAIEKSDPDALSNYRADENLVRMELTKMTKKN